MAENPNPNLVPRSFFRFPSTLTDFFSELQDRMATQWAGAETGVTVSEDSENVFVQANLPGLSEEDIDVTIHQNTLRIKGEKKEETQDSNKRYYRKAQSSFFYQVELPAQVEEDSEQASLKDGVLNISFKKTKQAQMKKINIQKTKSS
jgi:HSP20 family protein